jgi:hypothetical protein
MAIAPQRHRDLQSIHFSCAPAGPGWVRGWVRGRAQPGGSSRAPLGSNWWLRSGGTDCQFCRFPGDRRSPLAWALGLKGILDESGSKSRRIKASSIASDRPGVGLYWRLAADRPAGAARHCRTFFHLSPRYFAPRVERLGRLQTRRRAWTGRSRLDSQLVLVFLSARCLF